MNKEVSATIFEVSKKPKSMKTNYYILFILLLSFSFANAQSDARNTEKESNTVVSVSKNNKVVVFSLDIKSINETEKEELLIDSAKLKETIARGNSDIRLYLNRLRNADNIKLLFPKINKAKTA